MSGFASITMPPSANRLWRYSSRGVYRSREYMTWLRGVSWTLKAELGRIDGPFRTVIKLRPPDRRTRDLDNRVKPILDALEFAGCVENDALCQEIIARWDRSLNSECVVGVFHWREEAA